jgi:hypothetical protein
VIWAWVSTQAALAGLVDQTAGYRGAGVPSHGRNHAVLLGDLTILAKLHTLAHIDPSVSPDQQPPQQVHIPSAGGPPNMLRQETLHVECAVDRPDLFGRTIFRLEVDRD